MVFENYIFQNGIVIFGWKIKIGVKTNMLTKQNTENIITVQFELENVIGLLIILNDIVSSLRGSIMLKNWSDIPG